jgi:hypothetical protein
MKKTQRSFVLHRGRGRPRKFGRPARAMTLTLPEDVLTALATVDGDISRAVVRVMLPLLGDVKARLPAAELSKHRNGSVIVIQPEPALERIAGVTLVPLPDGRALISLDDAMTVAEFELKLRDALDGRQLDPLERAAISSIAGILRTARRTRGVAVEERNIIVLRSTRRRQRAG